jgi:hypothetical protein
MDDMISIADFTEQTKFGSRHGLPIFVVVVCGSVLSAANISHIMVASLPFVF